jgi:hypothetical protein
VKVKDSSEPFDVDAIMYAFAHPSFLRRIVFGVMETETATIRRRHKFGMGGGGYGHPIDCTQAETVSADLTIGLRQDLSTMDRDPVEWITSQLRTLGLEVETTA